MIDLLVDGDIANNAGNWQWVAGTGNDTWPNRRFNLLRQAQRFDPTVTTCGTTSPSWRESPVGACTPRGRSAAASRLPGAPWRARLVSTWKG
jgi:FAD binding domain of DNA photolyase